MKKTPLFKNSPLMSIGNYNGEVDVSSSPGNGTETTIEINLEK